MNKRELLLVSNYDFIGVVEYAMVWIHSVYYRKTAFVFADQNINSPNMAPRYIEGPRSQQFKEN